MLTGGNAKEQIITQPNHWQLKDKRIQSYIEMKLYLYV